MLLGSSVKSRYTTHPSPRETGAARYVTAGYVRRSSAHGPDLAQKRPPSSGRVWVFSQQKACRPAEEAHQKRKVRQRSHRVPSLEDGASARIPKSQGSVTILH